MLLIDEALATGDAHFRRRSEERVQELRAGAGTVFLVSHQLNTLRGSCERTIWLEAGVIRMDGPTDEVVAAYEEFVKATSGRGGKANGAAGSGTPVAEQHTSGKHRAEPASA